MPDNPGCPFCSRISRGDAFGTTDPRVVSFDPLNPVTPGHRLFVPTRHVASAIEDPVLAGWTVAAAADWAAGQVIDCNVITSCGSAATQTIGHLHVHVVPRKAGDGLPLPWTPQQTGDGIDWRGVVDRASAVAVGAGAPDDGATLPEQVEWLAGRLHGPTLRPGPIPTPLDVAQAVGEEIVRQDAIHPDGYPATRDGVRLAIATVVDEAQEALDAWRAERCKCPTPRCEHATWAETAGELVQAAAVALRAVREIRR